MSRRIVRGVLLAAVLCLAGCGSVYMKGTPLYTGEHKSPEGPAENRVNLWPLAYYRKPALSLLWPLMDFTDDHAAVRPLVSVYKLDRPKHQWNVLAPLAQFDFDTDDHRVFPAFWGKDYTVVFPLVWWYEKTKGIVPVFWWKDGFTVFPLVWHKWRERTVVFPLWMDFTEDSDERDTHVLWPLLRRVSTKAKKGWRVWPLVGSYRSEDGRHDWALWPLCHLRKKGDAVTRVAAPFYFGHRDGKEAWWLLLPLAYRRAKADGSDSLLLTPLWMSRRKGELEWQALLPVFYRRKDGEGSLTLTPVWSSGRQGPKSWSAVLPLYYHSSDGAGTSRLLTPLAARLRSPERTRWIVVPLASTLAWGKDEKDLWCLGPILHARWGGEKVQHHVLPLYYYDRNAKLFLSPLASWQNKEDHGFFNVLTLLAHYERLKDGRRGFHVPLLLSGFSWKGDEKSLWCPAPIARAKWSRDDAEQWVFPLFYHGRKAKMFLSPLFSVQDKGEKGFVNLGTLLAHYARKPGGRRSFHFLWPFGRVAWTQGRGLDAARLFPLFAWDRSQREWTEKTGEEKQEKKVELHTRSLWFFPWVHSSRREKTTTPPDGPPRTATTRRSGAFPLWSHKWEREGETTRADFHLLGRLYDHRLRLGVTYPGEPERRDYRRARLLWRVVHYEQLDGDESLDLFPFITWDRKTDGYRKASFFWRLFRSERTPDGGHNLDLLFLPVLRAKGKG